MDVFTNKIGGRLLEAGQYFVEMDSNTLRKIRIDSFQFLEVDNQGRGVSVPVVLNIVDKLLIPLTPTQIRYIVDIHVFFITETLLLLLLIRTTGKQDDLPALFQILRKLLLDRI